MLLLVGVIRRWDRPPFLRSLSWLVLLGGGEKQCLVILGWMMDVEVAVAEAVEVTVLTYSVIAAAGGAVAAPDTVAGVPPVVEMMVR